MRKVYILSRREYDGSAFVLIRAFEDVTEAEELKTIMQEHYCPGAVEVTEMQIVPARAPSAG